MLFRNCIAVMIFFTCYINFTTRINMAVSIVSMVASKSNRTVVPECLSPQHDANYDPNATTTPETFTPLPNYGPRYFWSEQLQGLILGSYFIGYIPTSLFGGWLSERFGPSKVIFWAQMLITVFHTLCIYSAWMHYIPFIICRIIIGACAGLVYPAIQVLIAKWAPQAEKGKFTGAMMGAPFGSAVTWTLLGWITMELGWEWGFYVITIENVVFCIVFFILVDDSPLTSKFISEEERDYIMEARGSAVSTKKAKKPPVKSILKSIPFWMLTILHIGSLWCLYVQLQSVPKFLAEVIGLNIRKVGYLSAIPQLVRMFAGLSFGYLEDFLVSKQYMTVPTIRKTFVVSSHFMPGICFLLIFAAKCHAYVVVVLLVFSMGFNGATTITNLRNSLDLAPNFAGTVFGYISFVGGFTGFVAPAILAEFIKYHSGLVQWGYYFVLSALIPIITGILFIAFGSAKLQPWNEIKLASSQAIPT